MLKGGGLSQWVEVFRPVTIQPELYLSAKLLKTFPLPGGNQRSLCFLTWLQSSSSKKSRTGALLMPKAAMDLPRLAKMEPRLGLGRVPNHENRALGCPDVQISRNEICLFVCVDIYIYIYIYSYIYIYICIYMCMCIYMYYMIFFSIYRTHVCIYTYTLTQEL